MRSKKELEAEIASLKELVNSQRDMIEQLVLKPAIQFVPMPSMPVPTYIQPINPYQPYWWWGTITCEASMLTAGLVSEVSQ